MFDLECPNCKEVTQVNDSPTEVPGGQQLDWNCSNCNATPITSLPTDENGELLNG